MLSWWQLAQERFPSFKNFNFKKDDGRTVSNQSPISHRPVADWSLMVTDYSEVVADQSLTDHRSVADQSLTKCKTIAERAATGRRLLATIPVVEKSYNGRRGRKQNQSPRGRTTVASSEGPGLKMACWWWPDSWLGRNSYYLQSSLWTYQNVLVFRLSVGFRFTRGIKIWKLYPKTVSWSYSKVMHFILIMN